MIQNVSLKSISEKWMEFTEMKQLIFDSNDSAI